MQWAQVRSLVGELDSHEVTKDLTCYRKDWRLYMLQLRPNTANKQILRKYLLQPFILKKEYLNTLGGQIGH